MRNCLSSADLDRLIAEDLPHGDLTTHVLSQYSGWCGRQGSLHMHARMAMQVCGVEEAQALFERLGATVSLHIGSGEQADEGMALLTAQGQLEALFAVWKVAQTLIEWASGVSSAVGEVLSVARAVNPDAVVACTRKTVPFTRTLAAKAVRCGGGSMHRLNLSDSLLLFPEHVQFLHANITTAQLIAHLRRAEPERSVVVEVTTLAEAFAMTDNADVLQLEKFPVEDVKRVALRLTPQQRPILAVAGGITPVNAAAYVQAGARVLVTSWPYYATPRDVQVGFADLA